eukprot:9665005-Heterocapsa_arctica.AAC.1
MLQLSAIGLKRAQYCACDGRETGRSREKGFVLALLLACANEADVHVILEQCGINSCLRVGGDDLE